MVRTRAIILSANASFFNYISFFRSKGLLFYGLKKGTPHLSGIPAVRNHQTHHIRVFDMSCKKIRDARASLSNTWYTFPTLALSKSGLQVGTNKHPLSAGLIQLPGTYELVQTDYSTAECVWQYKIKKYMQKHFLLLNTKNVPIKSVRFYLIILF